MDDITFLQWLLGTAEELFTFMNHKLLSENSAAVVRGQ